MFFLIKEGRSFRGPKVPGHLHGFLEGRVPFVLFGSDTVSVYIVLCMSSFLPSDEVLFLYRFPEEGRQPLVRGGILGVPEVYLDTVYLFFRRRERNTLIL